MTAPNSTSFKVASPDIVSEVFDDEVVVLNLATGRYFGMNRCASAAWEGLTSGVPTDQISSALKCQDTLAPFVAKLVEYGLVALGGEAQELSETLRARLSESHDGPTVEVFDDLADLIVADPIHDTETEAGWPVRASADGL